MLISTDEDKIVAVWLNVWLERQLKTYNAEVGDTVAIWYGGQTRSASGKNFNKYEVAVQKALNGNGAT